MKFLFTFMLLMFNCILHANPKILVLILASDDSNLYKKHQQCWEKYMNDYPENITCYFMKGNENLNSEFKIEGNTIWTRTKEQYRLPGLLDKTVISLEALQDKLDSFDYILRTNISSFVHFPNLIKFVSFLPKTKCYAGHKHLIINQPLLTEFIAGSGIIISSDVACLLLENKAYLLSNHMPKHLDMDDLAIANLLINKYNIPAIHKEFIKIESLNEWRTVYKKLNKHKGFLYRIRLSDCPREQYEIDIKDCLINKFYSK